jgi:putative zinc finger protein
MRPYHENVSDRLPEYLKGSLPESERREVELHLGECAECRDELYLIREITAVDVPDPGDIFWDSLPQRTAGLLKEEKTSRFSFRFFWFRLLPAAATIAVFVAVLLVSISKKKEPDMNHFFSDPLAETSMDYGSITEKDIPSIADYVSDDGAYMPSAYHDSSYTGELASLNSAELCLFEEALSNEQRNGG